VRSEAAQSSTQVGGAGMCNYVFNAQLSGNAADNQERIKLWIDNRLIVNQWSSLSAMVVEGSMALAQDTLYRLHILYKRSAVAADFGPRMLLRWSSSSFGDPSVACGAGSTTLAAIPSQQLLTSWRVLQQDTQAILQVDPALTASAACIAFGQGLSDATAGVEARFSVRARDVFGNLRLVPGEDDWLVRLVAPPPQSSFEDEVVHVAAAVFADVNLPSDYHVTYTATVAAEYSLSVERVKAGGLMAKHYNNAHLLGDFAELTVSENIDLNWPSAVPSANQETSDYHTWVSVRFAGFFKAQYTGTYTFFADAAEQDSVRLSVSGNLLGSRWSRVLDPARPEARKTLVGAQAHVISGSVRCVAGQLHEVTLDYRHQEGKAAIKFLYASQSVARDVVPSNRLFHSADHIYGSPFALTVLASITDAFESEVHGNALLGTAGIVSTFVIISRDYMGNAASTSPHTWIVYSAPSPYSPLVVAAAQHTTSLALTVASSTSAAGQDCASADAALDRNVAAVISPGVLAGQFNVRLLQMRAVPSVLNIALAVAGSLTATYYDISLLSPQLEAHTPGHDSQIWRPLASRQTDLNVGTLVSGVFSVRWAGFIRMPLINEEHTFYAAALTDRDERVRLWVDGILLIDAWNSLTYGVGAQPSATTAFASANAIYELVLDYKMSSITSAPRVALTSAHSAGTAIAIPSSRLFHARSHSLSLRSVVAAPTDFAMSTFVGEGVSSATAGILSRFTVICNDRYGNLRGHALCGSELKLALSTESALATAQSSTSKQFVFQHSQPPEHTDDGQLLQYVVTVSGTYQLHLFMGSASKGSTVHVRPGIACAAATLVSGHSMCLATAGYGASFTIQSRDAFGNTRSLHDDAFRVLLRGVGMSNRHDCRASTMAQLPASNLGSYTVAYRSSRSGLFSLDVRLVSEGRGHLNMTCLSDALHGSGVSLAYTSDGPAAHLVSTPSTNIFSARCGALNSARWEGSVSARFSETYTYHAEVESAGERVRLWVEDRWIIDEWTSLSSLTPSGTLFMAKDILVDVGVVYREGPSSSAKGSMTLKWSSGSEPLMPVHTDRLFSLGSHVRGSPFNLAIFPARTCGSVTGALGQGLSLATAGIAARLTILAKDHLGNMRGDAGYSSQVDGVEPTFAAFVRSSMSRDMGGTVTALGAGKYQVDYTATLKRNKLTYDDGNGAAGAAVWAGSALEEEAAVPLAPLHQVSLVLAEQGAVHATYYNSQNFTKPNRARLSTTFSMHVTASAALASGCVSSEQGFSVRFKGMLRPPGQQRYTFTATMAGPQQEERVRLWIDNVLLIDQWASIATLTPTGAMQLGDAGTSRSLYDLQLEFKGASNASSAVESDMALKMAYFETAYASSIPSSLVPLPVVATTPRTIPSEYL